MKKRKIGFMTDRCVQGIEDKGDKLCLNIGPFEFASNGNENTQKTKLIVDKLLACIGRKPMTEGIGLETVGVATDDGGWIKADDRMETNVSGIYAIGDVLGPSKIMLAHVASTEGSVAAENIMGGNRLMRYDTVPTGIYTMPEVANVGLTEDQAREQGYPIRSDVFLFRNLGKSQVIDEIAGEVKMVSETVNGRILGVHIIGPHATDLIAEGTLAIQSEYTVKELAETIHAHPTLSEALMEVSLKASDNPLHG
jgi:dihydrolipoamide dehydrogenase